jgi:predicted Ser/Thr protein kinase
MEYFQSVKMNESDEAFEIDASKDYPIISMGSQSVTFKISKEQCLKIYTNMEQFKLEANGLAAAQGLPFTPRLYKIGRNYIVREFFDAPTLKDYLRNCTYMPEQVAEKLLALVKEMDQANLMMGSAPLKDIFVHGNEELKWVSPVEATEEGPSVPLSLLSDLKDILLKDSFLSHVKNLDPGLYGKWMEFFRKNRLDIEKITAFTEGKDGISTHNLIGQGRQGAVYRVDEEKCVKIYGNQSHFVKEREVLQACQHLPFIPKVYETGPNYILMEYLNGPDLNAFLKRQSTLAEEVTKNLLAILVAMKKFGFKRIDAPLRHVFITNQGFKLVDHVYSFSKKQDRPLELFRNLHERDFLDSFLEQVKAIDPMTYAEWTSRPIPLTKEGAAAENAYSKKMKKAKKEKNI